MKSYFYAIAHQFDKIFFGQFREAWQVGIKQYEQAKTVAYGLLSYHWVNNTLDFLWQYHMVLAFTSASSFAAATSTILFWTSLATMLISASAPFVHNIWPQSAGKILPSVLLLFSTLFFCLILFPGLFSALSLDPLILACCVGATLEMLFKSCRHNFTEVFHLRQWTKLSEKIGGKETKKIQTAVNALTNKPTRAISAIMIMLLTASFVPFSVAKWVFALLVLPVVSLWCLSVYSAPSYKKPSENTVYYGRNFWLMTAYTVCVQSSLLLLMVFKSTIVATYLGTVSIPYLKLAVLPVILLTNHSLNYLQKHYNSLPFIPILVTMVMGLLLLVAIFSSGLPMAVTCASVALYLSLDAWALVVWDYIYSPSSRALFQHNAGQYMPWLNLFCSLAQMGMSQVSLYLTQGIGLSNLHLLVVAVGVFTVLNIAVSVLYDAIKVAARNVDPGDAKTEPLCASQNYVKSSQISKDKSMASPSRTNGGSSDSEIKKVPRIAT